MLLLQHELCRIYALFWSNFGADIEDFVQILCRFLHKKMLVGSSDRKADLRIRSRYFFVTGLLSFRLLLIGLIFLKRF